MQSSSFGGRAAALCALLFALLTPLSAAAGQWAAGIYGNLWGAREYQVWLPTGYQAGTRVPLVMAIHGCPRA